MSKTLTGTPWHLNLRDDPVEVTADRIEIPVFIGRQGNWKIGNWKIEVDGDTLS